MNSRQKRFVNNKFQTSSLQVVNLTDDQQQVNLAKKSKSKLNAQQRLQQQLKLLYSSSVDHSPNDEYKLILMRAKALQQKKLMHYQEQDNKIQQDVEEANSKQQELIQHKKRLRVALTKKKMIAMKENQQQRCEQVRLGNQKVQEYQKKQLLYQTSLNQQDQRKIQEALLFRKLKLEQIRDLHRSVSNQELINHQRKSDEMSKKIQDSKLQEKLLLSHTEMRKYPYNDIYKIVQEEQAKAQLDSETRMEKLKDMQERKKQFLQDVKEKFRPTISLDKQLELKMMQKHHHHKINFKHYKVVSDSVKTKKFNNYLMKSIEINNNHDDDLDFNDFERSTPISNIETINQRELGNQYMMMAQQKRKLVPLSINQSCHAFQGEQLGSNDKLNTNSSILMDSRQVSLSEMKQKSKIHQRDILNDWQKMLSNYAVDDQTRNVQLLQEANKLEQISKRKFELAKLKGPRSSIDVNINAYLVEAIKAKMQILNN